MKNICSIYLIHSQLNVPGRRGLFVLTLIVASVLTWTFSGCGSYVVTSGKETLQLSMSTSGLDFGSVTLDTTSAKSLTLTSTGTSPVTIDSVTLTGTEFRFSGISIPATISPGQAVVLQVIFKPTAAGGASGDIMISTNASNEPTQKVHLAGSGSSPPSAQLSLSSTDLNFGGINVDTISKQTLELTSAGGASVTVKSVTLTGAGFAVSGSSFPATLNPGQSLALQVSFDPTTPGAANGTITIVSDSSSGATSSVSLTGTGTAAQLTFSADSLAFGSVNLNTSSSKTVTLTSSGNTPVTVKSATLTGTAFKVSGGVFPATLNPGQSLALQVSFDPSTAGTATGSITIASNSMSDGTGTITLTGIGTKAGAPELTISASTLNFGNVQVGNPVTLSLTLSSTGTSPVTVSTASISGAGFTFSGATFPVTLNPTIGITIQVQFDPTTVGAAEGTLAFSSNSGSGSTSMVTLTGTVAAVQHRVTLTWTAPVNSPVVITGYNIYRATGTDASFQLIHASGTTEFADAQVTSGMSFSYYVTSTDDVGTESTPSNEMTVTIP